METNQPKKDESFQFCFDKSKKNLESITKYVDLIIRMHSDYNTTFKTYKEISNEYIKKLTQLSSNYSNAISSYEKNLTNPDDKIKDLLNLIQRIPEIFNLQIAKMKSIQLVTQECCEDNPELKQSTKKFIESKGELDLKTKNIYRISQEFEFNKKNLFIDYRNFEDYLKYNIIGKEGKNVLISDFCLKNSPNINEKEKFYMKSIKDLNKHQKDYIAFYNQFISFSVNKFQNTLDSFKSKISAFATIFLNTCKTAFNDMEQFIKKISETDLKIDYSSLFTDLTEKIEFKFTVDKYVINLINNRYIDDKKKEYDHQSLRKYNYYISDNTIYLKDEDVFDIIQIMYGQFQFIEEKYYDLAKEKKKIQIKNLTDKLLYFGFKINIFYGEEIPPIKEKEVVYLISLLDKPYYRFEFLKIFNLFRTKGLCEFPKDSFEYTKRIFLFIAEKIKEEKDFLSPKLILILSQTFYTKENNEKIYLFKYLKSHEMFNHLEVWDKYLTDGIDDDLKRAKINNLNENLNNNNDNNKSAVINNVLMAHLFSFCHNMIEFGMKIEDIKKIIDPKIKQYNLSEESIIQINKLIENKSNGKDINEA